MATNPTKILEMSDEDIGNMTAPPAETPTEAPTPAEPDNGGDPPAKPVEPTPPAPEPKADPKPVNPVPAPAPAEPGKEKVEDESELWTPGSEPKEAKEPKAPEPKPDQEEAADPKPSEGETAPKGSDQEPAALAAFYDKIMTPFKANGKTIELRSPDEAIQLMQMGANYTKKLQDLQPHRKMLMMLENNGLMDEGKLSFLIDLERKDPEAIKKLLKDTGIDPLEIDTSEDPAYLEGNHRVSDEEVGFRTTLDELSSNPTGAKTLTEINTAWDQASKEVLWQAPEIMTVIHEQRENGVYDVIKAEVDRQMTLGKIPPNTPFLQAYKVVGDAMAHAALGTTDGQPNGVSESGQAEAPQVLATRTATPKSQVANSDRASAASPTRASPKMVKQLVNPLAESDEAFLKRMENRL